jgi:hypothetical protein
MKKIIRAEDFPIEMSEENIDILARMALEEIIPDEWREISNILSDDQRVLINNRISQIQKEKERLRWESLTAEEQAEEKQKIENSLKEGSHVFRGNILQQEWDSMELERMRKEKKKNEKNTGCSNYFISCRWY